MKSLSPFTVLFAVLFTFTVTSSYGQSSKATRSVFQEITIKEQTTILFDGASYSTTTLNQLRQDLLMYEGKVSSVILDTDTKQLSITYNGFMRRDDFENAFTKNGVSFYRATTANKDVLPSTKQ